MTHLLCLRDEDDQLYEKLSGEQWRLECLMQLLAELKESDLPGDFFLALLKVKVQANLKIFQVKRFVYVWPRLMSLLLQDLTTWAATADEELRDEEQVDVAAMTLLEAENRLLGGAERRARRLALLQVVAVMIECLQHTQLLRKTSQVSRDEQKSETIFMEERSKPRRGERPQKTNNSR